MNIPEEAVEAAAEAAFSRTHPSGNWRLAVSEMRDCYLAEARAALEAAAPHMLAGAWDEGHRTCRLDPDSIEYNPYRSQA